MARKDYHCSDATFAKWIKEGRGQGRGHEYKPWITVRDLPSLGRSHRVFGHKSQRTHHILSDLELAVFMILEWHKDTIEIREQFPLKQDDTIKIAKSVGIKHPANNGVLQYMSSDFLVSSNDKKRPKYVLQAKYTDAFADPRTIEKLELERRYWEQKEVPFQLVTEKEIPETVFQNIEWLYPENNDDIHAEKLVDLAEFYLNQFQSYPNHTIIEIGKKIDTAYDQELGESLRDMRLLLAKRCFKFDIYTPIRKLKAIDFILSDMHILMEESRVSS